ncbi:MAG: LemA family protein [Alphaproteobacteria bacterium]|nr:LemA family protein [Alphaproteobacteria bacterium]
MGLLQRYWWVAALLLVGLFVGSGINTIPTLDEQVKASWSQVENQYQRRMDLIPNLVETVKGEANFEQKTLTDVIDARARATQVTLTPEMLNDPAAVQKFEAVQGQLGSALSRLMAVSENYPDLKANQGFLALQSQLEGTENRIAVARKDYIATVQAYNIRVRTFPGVIWARIYGAQPKAEFAATTGAETPPAVKF